MRNAPRLSKRATHALRVLADGGRFLYRLERNPRTGRDHFKGRLRAADGSTVPGISTATLIELQRRGLVVNTGRRAMTGGLEEYRLRLGDDDTGYEAARDVADGFETAET